MPHEPVVITLDAVNPLPFILDLNPPRGVNLWFDTNLPWPPPSQVFADVDLVFIPKIPTAYVVTAEALARYGDWLARDYTVFRETSNWRVLIRRGHNKL